MAGVEWGLGGDVRKVGRERGSEGRVFTGTPRVCVEGAIMGDGLREAGPSDSCRLSELDSPDLSAWALNPVSPLCSTIDAVREIRKYDDVTEKVNLQNNPGAVEHFHMKLFRAQRNLYIAGFSLLLSL